MLQRVAQKTIRWEFKDVGTIFFRYNKRSRNLSLSISPAKRVTVTIPTQVTLAHAKGFVITKKLWILKKFDEIDKRYQPIINFNGYKTREHVLYFQPAEVEKIGISINGKTITIQHPANANTLNEELQNIAKETLVETFRKEAQAYLPQRLEHLAKQHGFSYNTLRIKNIKSRWGSCSYTNNINLSLYLMKLPNHLIDYVLLHELVHTVHKNHGPDFWALLDSITGNAKALSKQVREYRPDI